MRRRFPIALPLALTLALGCGGGSEPAGPDPAIALALGAATLSLTHGQSATVAVTVSRTEFSGAIDLSLEGAPAGVTGTFSPSTLPGSAGSSTLTLTATTAAASGTHPLTVRAVGTGVPAQTASLQLSVTAAGSYTMGVEPTALTLPQGSSGVSQISVQRTNFPDPITLSVGGAPTGATANVSPASLTGTSASLNVATGTAAVGTYTLTVTATAAAVADRTATLTLTVTAAEPLTIATPEDVSAVVGDPFELQLQAAGPGTLTFESAGAPLPAGLALDSQTGRITGAPTADALLSGSPLGAWEGVVVRVSNGLSQAETAPFVVTITGADLPEPYAYMPFDGTSVNDVFGRAGVPVGNVSTGRQGVIGEAVFVGGTDSFIRYPTTLSSHLNGKAGFTIATSIRTTSAGTMFFGLSDRFLHFNRAYAGLDGGLVEFGGRSRNADDESFRAIRGNRTVNDGAFHSIVGVMDLAGDRATLYVDGRLDATNAVPFAASTFESFTPANQNVVGHITTLADTPQAPDVTHDELALWDRVLNDAQAATLAWLMRTGRSIREWIGF